MWIQSGKEGAGQTERVAGKRALPYAKQPASGNLPYDAGSSKPVPCDKLERGDGVGLGERLKGEGTYAHRWLVHVDVWQGTA